MNELRKTLFYGFTSFWIIVSIIIIIMLLGFVSSLGFKKNIITDDSPDKEYQLVVTQLGDGIGPRDFSMKLNKESKELSSTTVRIDTDGSNGNRFFKIEWYDTYVGVIVSNLGSRNEEDHLFKLYYNGNVIQEENDIDGIK